MTVEKQTQRITSDRGIEEFYDEFCGYLARDRLFPNPRHDRIAGFVGELFRGFEIEEVLEIGCGVGITSELIRKRGGRVVALDISGRNIHFARLTVPGVVFLQGDFLTSQVEGQFSLVTLFDALEHFPLEVHERVFTRIAGLTAERGLLAITIPDAAFQRRVLAETPELRQVVDEIVELGPLLETAGRAEFDLLRYERFGVDYEDQYAFLLFRKSTRHVPARRLSPPKGLRKLRFLIRARWNWFRHSRTLREYGVTWSHADSGLRLPPPE